MTDENPSNVKRRSTIGRPPGKSEPKTKMVSFRLKFEDIEWLKAQPGSQAQTISRLIREARKK